MSVLMKPSDETENGSDRCVLLVKGAAELLINRCSHAMLEDGSIIPIDPLLRQDMIKTAEDMGARSLRCLALAKKVHSLSHTFSLLVFPRLCTLEIWLLMMEVLNIQVID